MERKPRYVVTTPGLIRRAKRRFAIVKGLLGLITGLFFAFVAAAIGALLRIWPTMSESETTLGELYDLTVARSPHVGTVIKIAILLTVFFSVLPAYINPYIPVSSPPKKYIKRMFISDTLAAVAPTFGYCVFGWLGFGIGCSIPFLVFPWEVRSFSA